MKFSIRTWIALVLGFLAGVFVFQNTEVVDVSFLFWHVSLSRVLLLLITLSIGLIIGFLLGWEVFSHRRKRKDREGQININIPPTTGS